MPVEPIHRSNGERNAQKENEKQFREKVDLLVEKRHFVAWKSLVHLRACLSSCVDDKTKDNMRGSKDCICPHCIFQVHRLHGLVFGSQVLSLVQAHKVVDFLVWLVTIENGMLEISNFLHVSERLLRFNWPNKRLGGRKRPSNFPVRFTIKLVGANEQTS